MVWLFFKHYKYVDFNSRKYKLTTDSLDIIFLKSINSQNGKKHKAEILHNNTNNRK